MIFELSNRFTFVDSVETSLAKESGILFPEITIPTKMMVRKGNLKNIFRSLIWKLKQVKTNSCFYNLLIAKKIFLRNLSGKELLRLNCYKFSFVLIFMVRYVS